MPKKILYLVNSLNAGGIETYLLRFLRFYREDKAQILCKSGVAGDLEAQYKEVTEGISLLRIGYLNLWSFYKLYRFLKKERFDVICDFTGNFAGIPLWVAKKAGVKKRLVFYRGSTNRFKQNKLKLLYNDFVNRLTDRYATKILSNSHAAFDFFYPGRSGESRFEVIYNGIDVNSLPKTTKQEIRKELGIPPEVFLIGHTGRYCYAKNHRTILEVAFTLCERYENIRFVLIGKGVDDACKQKIVERRLEDKILLLGYRKDVLHLLPALDLFYFPSISEGQPNALIEAMVTGIPVVASDIPSIRESVPEKMYDLLIPPCDVEKAISVIRDIYLQKTDRDCYKCQEWARQHFDADRCFLRFREEL